MGFGLILTGFLFLVIPTVNVIDIMPDFIGYILIFIGLSKQKRIDSYMYKASHYALIMAIINLAKPVVLAFCLNDSHTAQSSNITTATLIFLVIELIAGILLIKNLFDGFSDLGFQYGDSKRSVKKLLGRFIPARKKLSYENSIHNKQSAEYKRLVAKNGLHPVQYVTLPKRKAIFNGVDGLYIFTLIFFVVRTVMTLLPELTTLAYTLTSSGTYEQVQSTGLRITLIILCLFLGTVLGIAWYISSYKYLSGVKNDEDFISSLKLAYKTKITDNPDVTRSIKYTGFYRIMLAALIFGGDLFFDGTDFIPDIISATLFMIAILWLAKYYKAKVLAIFTSALYIAASVTALVLQILSLDTFYLYTGKEAPATVKAFGVLFPILKALFLLLVVFTLFSQLRYIKTNFGRAPMYSRGKLIVGTSIIAASQIGSAVGYFTDVISEELIRFPVKIGRAVWYANVYVSFGSLIVYIVGIIIFIGGLEAVSNKLAGKE